MLSVKRLANTVRQAQEFDEKVKNVKDSLGAIAGERTAAIELLKDDVYDPVGLHELTLSLRKERLYVRLVQSGIGEMIDALADVHTWIKDAEDLSDPEEEIRTETRRVTMLSQLYYDALEERKKRMDVQEAFLDDPSVGAFKEFLSALEREEKYEERFRKQLRNADSNRKLLAKARKQIYAEEGTAGGVGNSIGGGIFGAIFGGFSAYATPLGDEFALISTLLMAILFAWGRISSANEKVFRRTRQDILDSYEEKRERLEPAQKQLPAGSEA